MSRSVSRSVPFAVSLTGRKRRRAGRFRVSLAVSLAVPLAVPRVVSQTRAVAVPGRSGGGRRSSVCRAKRGRRSVGSRAKRGRRSVGRQRRARLCALTAAVVAARGRWWGLLLGVAACAAGGAPLGAWRLRG